jgi:hypothetical protein
MSETTRIQPAEETVKPKRRRPFRKFLLFLLVLAVLAITTWVLLGSVFYYSKGFREGYVYKFSSKGVMFKTWEGILKTGFINFNNTSTPNEEWTFSAVDKGAIDALNKSGERVYLKLHYKQHFTKLFWRGDTKYFVYKVEVMEKRQ